MTKIILQLLALIALLVILSSTDLLISSNMLMQGKTVNINKDWQYLEDNQHDVQLIDKAKDWESIDLPHTWNQWNAVDNAPGYRRDVSWYKKEIEFPNYENAQYLLYFEGVNISSEIYVNGTKVGGHVVSNVGFEIDVTENINKGKRNRVDIKVNNVYKPVITPSQKAFFLIYGGITRNVWLIISPQVNLKKTQINTPNVSNTSTNLVNDFEPAIH